MEVDMVDFLPIPVIDEQAVMVGHAEFLGHQSCSGGKLCQNFGRGGLEVPVLGFGKDQEVDLIFGAMIGDHDDGVGLVEDFGRELPVDDASKDRRHGRKIGGFCSVGHMKSTPLPKSSYCFTLKDGKVLNDNISIIEA
jgi:hypothetical protein